jgi:uncharacterized protein (TIGR03083 family)
LSRELLMLLKALQPADWARPTICSPWTVKDVAAHLLGGNLGRLRKSDELAASPEIPVRDYNELVAIINRDNRLWVQAAQRISPEILIEFLDLTDRRLYEHFAGLPQDKPARITVAWAGNDLPPNWFDISREYTEKWLHQQHIREAVGRPVLMSRAWLSPVLDTFMRGLPYTYRNVIVPDGISVSFKISGEAGGEWTLAREGNKWRLLVGSDPNAAGFVQIDQDLAWRLFTKGVTHKEAQRQVHIEGNKALGDKALDMVSLMA